MLSHLVKFKDSASRSPLLPTIGQRWNVWWTSKNCKHVGWFDNKTYNNKKLINFNEKVKNKLNDFFILYLFYE